MKIKGLNSAGDTDSPPEIDQMYQQHDAQVLYNPMNQFKAMRRMQKGPNTGRKDSKVPGISDNSKKIKKDKKPIKTKL